MQKGCFRYYFHIGRLGFKIPRYNSYNGNPFLGFLSGILMNVLERKRYKYYVQKKTMKQWGHKWAYQGKTPCLCPCYFSLFGLFNVYKHLPVKLDWEGLSKDVDYLTSMTAYLMVNDIKPVNFRTDSAGCLYCIDYGDFEIGNLRRTGVLNIDYK